MKGGRLEIICGSMFSGKTEELMRRLKRAEFAKKKVLTIKHQIDQRKNNHVTAIASHNGQKRVALPIDNSETSVQTIKKLSQKDIDVIGIDEIQFFPSSIITVINSLINKGKCIIASGLDLDFRGKPFGIVPELMCLADSVLKLKAICVQCGQDAHFSQRILNGKPAQYDDPLILVGTEEYYEARCRICFVVNKKPPMLPNKTEIVPKESFA